MFVGSLGNQQPAANSVLYWHQRQGPCTRCGHGCRGVGEDLRACTGWAENTTFVIECMR